LKNAYLVALTPSAYAADRPATKAELRITQCSANIDWRVERLVMMETCLTNIDAATHCDDIISRFGSIDAIGVITETWKETCKGPANAVELLRRYQGSLNHQMDSAHKMFDRYQERRLDRMHQGHQSGKTHQKSSLPSAQRPDRSLTSKINTIQSANPEACSEVHEVFKMPCHALPRGDS